MSTVVFQGVTVETPMVAKSELAQVLSISVDQPSAELLAAAVAQVNQQKHAFAESSAVNRIPYMFPLQVDDELFEGCYLTSVTHAEDRATLVIHFLTVKPNGGA